VRMDEVPPNPQAPAPSMFIANELNVNTTADPEMLVTPPQVPIKAKPHGGSAKQAGIKYKNCIAIALCNFNCKRTTVTEIAGESPKELN
jgi:hypothetical protein